MDDSLEQLRQRRRKLLYHFGERIRECHRTCHVEFAFSPGNSAQEKEIVRLLNLLYYMDERILKFEQMATPEEEEQASRAETGSGSNASGEQTEPVAGEVVEGESEIPQEKAEAAPEPAVENNSEILEEKPEIAPEQVFENEETPEPVAESAGEIPEEKPEIAPEPVAETSPDNSSDEEFSCATETLYEPVPSDSSEMRVDTPPTTLTFQAVLAGAQFKSETEKSLFEDNLDALQTGDERARSRALKTLSYLSGKETFQNVCRLALGDPSSEIRMAALKAAGRTRRSENAELYCIGLRDEDAGVRIASIKGLSMLLLNDSRLSVEPLLRDPDARVRGIATTCLGIYGGAEGVRVASESWKDQDAYVRKSLADMLAIVQAPGSLTVVKQLLEDRDEGVRRAAKNALNKAKPAWEKERQYGNC